MKVDIFIVSRAKDFGYLLYALRSIGKFATRIHNTVVMIPRQDVQLFHFKIPSENLRFTIDIKPFDEWPDKGFLHHEYLVMTSPDYCPGADYIMHLDSDTIFMEPVSPDDYFINGKPVLIHARFDWLITQQANLINWRIAAQTALGINVEREFMRRHPAVHIPEVYRKTQAIIEAHHQKPLADYVRAGKNEFPQSVCEYATLGAVAWDHFHDRYHWVDQEKDPWPKNKLKQYWTHAGVTNTVLEEFKKIGIA